MRTPVTNSVPQGEASGSLTKQVPHISLVFREMWDTTDVDRSVHRMTRESEGRSSGIPHLAKNERDAPNFLYAAAGHGSVCAFL